MMNHPPTHPAQEYYPPISTTSDEYMVRRHDSYDI